MWNSLWNASGNALGNTSRKISGNASGNILRNVQLHLSYLEPPNLARWWLKEGEPHLPSLAGFFFMRSCDKWKISYLHFHNTYGLNLAALRPILQLLFCLHFPSTHSYQTWWYHRVLGIPTTQSCDLLIPLSLDKWKLFYLRFHSNYSHQTWQDFYLKRKLQKSLSLKKSRCSKVRTIDLLTTTVLIEIGTISCKCNKVFF